MSKPEASVPVDFSFGKVEHLCKQSLIELLYAQQQSVYSHPFKLTYLKVPSLPAPSWVKVQVMFPVSKKKHKRANKRNQTRRIVRELYRLNKQALLAPMQHCPFSLALSISYTDTETIDFHKHGKSMQKALTKLADLITNYI